MSGIFTIPTLTREMMVHNIQEVGPETGSKAQLNNVDPVELTDLQLWVGRPIVDDVDYELVKSEFIADASKDIVASTSGVTLESGGEIIAATTPVDPDMAEFDKLTKAKSLYEKLMEGCTAKPFGPVCSFCSGFPNEQAYLNILNSAIDKLANMIEFRKVWKDILKLGDFDLLHQMNMCVLNITRAGTAAVRVTAMAKATLGDVDAVKALGLVVLKRGGWMEPVDFVFQLMKTMEYTISSVRSLKDIWTSTGALVFEFYFVPVSNRSLLSSVNLDTMRPFFIRNPSTVSVFMEDRDLRKMTHSALQLI